MRPFLHPWVACAMALVALVRNSPPALSQAVWPGLTKNFSKVAGSNDLLPENQDAILSSVKLTRGTSGGLINVASESSFNQSSSPAGTEWATTINNPSLTVDAAHHVGLAFTDWFDAYNLSGTHGSVLTGTNAVVHLIASDVYLDLTFTSWTAGNNGGFSYVRAEPPAATGDYNGNGRVDASDYVLWRHSSGQNPAPVGVAADGNVNGMIDSGDYTFWRTRFGNVVSGSGAIAAAVPESASLSLALQLILSVACALRYRS
jgi:hypothetical protein